MFGEWKQPETGFPQPYSAIFDLRCYLFKQHQQELMEVYDTEACEKPLVCTAQLDDIEMRLKNLTGTSGAGDTKTSAGAGGDV